MSRPDADADAAMTEPPHESSWMARRLRSFPPPDLEVVIGPKQHIFRYHANMLASQSAYVDTLLSSPMAVREQKKWRVTFPEMKVETWQKMLALLEPGWNRKPPSPSDIIEVLPYYDKYQFQDGLNICDSIISMYLAQRGASERLAPLAAKSFDLNLPRSKPLAAKWAANQLKRMRVHDEETIRLLMPLVENDDSVLMSLVWTVRGRKCNGMTVDEMRSVTQEPTFPGECILRCAQIQEVDEILRNCSITNLMVSASGNVSVADGMYNNHEAEPNNILGFSESHNGGAMRFVWIYSARIHSETIKIESKDVFGLVWEISAVSWPEPDDEEEESEEGQREEIQNNRRILCRWEGGYSSFLPPKFGWEIVEQGDALNSKLHINYSFQHRPY